MCGTWSEYTDSRNSCIEVLCLPHFRAYARLHAVHGETPPQSLLSKMFRCLQDVSLFARFQGLTYNYMEKCSSCSQGLAHSLLPICLRSLLTKLADDKKKLCPCASVHNYDYDDAVFCRVMLVPKEREDSMVLMALPVCLGKRGKWYELCITRSGCIFSAQRTYNIGPINDDTS